MLCSGCFGTGDVIGTRQIVGSVFWSLDVIPRFFLRSFSDCRATALYRHMRRMTLLVEVAIAGVQLLVLSYIHSLDLRIW